MNQFFINTGIDLFNLKPQSKRINNTKIIFTLIHFSYKKNIN